MVSIFRGIRWSFKRLCILVAKILTFQTVQWCILGFCIVPRYQFGATHPDKVEHIPPSFEKFIVKAFKRSIIYLSEEHLKIIAFFTAPVLL